MDGYYAYMVDQSGRVFRRVNLALNNDRVAVERAKELVDGHDVELWQRDRKIATFKHQEEAMRLHAGNGLRRNASAS